MPPAKSKKVAASKASPKKVAKRTQRGGEKSSSGGSVADDETDNGSSEVALKRSRAAEKNKAGQGDDSHSDELVVDSEADEPSESVPVSPPVPSIIPRRLNGAVAAGDADRCVNYLKCKGRVVEPTFRSVFCDRCEPWKHSYHVPFSHCEDGGSEDCVFCEQLKLGAKAKPMDIDYENPEDLSGMVLEKHKGKLSEDLPSGDPKDWTYFFNAFNEEGDQNVKIGDCIYLGYKPGTANYRKRGFAMRVQYVIKDKNGECYLSGYAIYPPAWIKTHCKTRHEEVYADYALMFSDVDEHVWAPISAVTGSFVLLATEDMRNGWPCGFPKGQVYNWKFDYSAEDDEVNLVESVDYRPCSNQLLWKPRGSFAFGTFDNGLPLPKPKQKKGKAGRAEKSTNVTLAAGDADTSAN